MSEIYTYHENRLFERLRVQTKFYYIFEVFKLNFIYMSIGYSMSWFRDVVCMLQWTTLFFWFLKSSESNWSKFSEKLIFYVVENIIFFWLSYTYCLINGRSHETVCAVKPLILHVIYFKRRNTFLCEKNFPFINF